MKKVLLFIIAIIIALPVMAQEKSAKSTEKNVLKVNTISLFAGTGSIFYEHKLSDATSGQLGAAYMGFKLGDTKFTGLILTPEFRYYPKNGAIDGFYLAPYLRYQRFTAKVTNEDVNGSLTSMGGGLLLGRQWITNSGFTMDLFFGAHYASATVKADAGGDSEVIDSNFFKGFKPRVGFALGFAF